MENTTDNSSPDYKKIAGIDLKVLLVKTGLSYSEISKILNNKGMTDSEATLAHKVSRGSYSHAWYLQVLDCLGKSLEVKDKNG